MLSKTQARRHKKLESKHLQMNAKVSIVKPCHQKHKQDATIARIQTSPNAGKSINSQTHVIKNTSRTPQKLESTHLHMNAKVSIVKPCYQKHKQDATIARIQTSPNAGKSINSQNHVIKSTSRTQHASTSTIPSPKQDAAKHVNALSFQVESILPTSGSFYIGHTLW